MKILRKIRRLAVHMARSRPARWLRTFLAWQPFTWRGLFALVLATVAVRFFAIADFDLVADVIGRAVLALLAITLIAAFVLRIRIGQRLRFEAHFEPVNVFSREEIPAGLVAVGSSLPPFFSLRVRRRFKHAGVVHPTHILRNQEPKGGKRHLIDSIVFPHRGYWELEAIDCALGDILGLVNFSWSQPLQSGVEVGVRTIPIQPLPIVAASARSGDQISKSNERAGDLFDLKQYDPSDGIKRILWKAYAKSGQLVVRRPEPAVIPEGEVALYLIARPEEDYVAGALQSYAEQLEAQQITILFATDGVGELALGDNRGFVTADHHIREVINRCVWSNDVGSGRGFGAFIEALERAGRSMTNVVIFGAVENTWMNQLNAAAMRSSIRLSLALVPEQLDQQNSLANLHQQITRKKVQAFAAKFPRLLQTPVRIAAQYAQGVHPQKAKPFSVSGKIGQAANCDVMLVQSTDNVTRASATHSE